MTGSPPAAAGRRRIRSRSTTWRIPRRIRRPRWPGRQEQDGLAAMVAALPTELRECLVLREFEELSYRDIARVTGVPVGTVMSRLWRARRALMSARAERIKA
jgi:DNA-directed RNA polymerase specialized sigma24 family protein